MVCVTINWRPLDQLFFSPPYVELTFFYGGEFGSGFRLAAAFDGRAVNDEREAEHESHSAQDR